MPDTLPSQRALLTTLVRALSETHHDEPGGASSGASSSASSSAATRPWDALRRRALILTLHVIFPGMLLPALDLLDRNLVRRLLTRREDGESAVATAARSRRAVYTVCSTRPRGGGGGGAHLVHLDAWSCSCAAFAVDAYAGTGGREEEEEGGGAPRTTAGVGGFGGCSRTWLDDGGAEATPCCKHLLACLLVDEWEELRLAHVEEKSCTREELAGIIAGI